MHCHKVILESLERMLLERYLEEKDGTELFSSLPGESADILESMMQSLDSTKMDHALNNNAIANYIKGYIRFRDSVRDERLGKTGQLWVSYMDHLWLILSLIQTVKYNDFMTYAHSLYLTADLFFAFGGQNYARHLTYFSIFLANVDSSHPGGLELIKRGAISVARSFIPGNRSMWIKRWRRHL